MKISDFFKGKGAEKVLEDTNFDLGDARLYLIRECGLEKGKDISKYMKFLKQKLVELTQGLKNSPRIQEFIDKLKGKNYDN